MCNMIIWGWLHRLKIVVVQKYRQAPYDCIKLSYGLEIFKLRQRVLCVHVYTSITFLCNLMLVVNIIAYQEQFKTYQSFFNLAMQAKIHPIFNPLLTLI